MKAEVLAAIGEAGLSRPAAVNAALAANDRVKYCLSLLQVAAAHADQPDPPAESLRRERIACGIDEDHFDTLSAGTRREGAAYRIPGVDAVLDRIRGDMRTMAAPVIEAGIAGFANRLDAVLGTIPSATDDLLDSAALAAMSTASPGPGGDSLHRLVLDLHRQLNALQTGLAEETIDGAAAYGLADEDRPRVAAFMSGLNRTARLKFDHPGLGTTATRDGARLVIQNDIGTTDAHVVVFRVEGWIVRVTYTDVHPERLRFFQDLLAKITPEWETTQGGKLDGGSAFQLTTGRIEAADEAELRGSLEFLGSRLVFLIDWNRARRQLRSFLPGNTRVSLLQWAAAQDVGHRAFLELGGAKLINQAIEATAGSAMHFGDRLCDVLGVAETEQFLRFVLRAATDCLIARQSPALLRDRIRTELARHFTNEHRRLLRLGADHAGLVFELASLVRDGTLALKEANHAAAAKRALAWEHDADRLVGEVREVVRRRPDYRLFVPLMHAADDAADELEEAVFLLSLLSEVGADDSIAEPLQALAALLVEAAQEWVKALLHAAHAEDRSTAEDADDFLVAIDRIAALEHAADDAERALTVAAVRQAKDFRQLHLYAELGARLEAAADALKHTSLLLRDHVLGSVLHG